MKIMSLLNKAKFKKHNMFRILGCTRAVAAVEFALIMPPFLLALLGLADYGLMAFEKIELTSAARAGAQVALFNDATTTTTTIKNTVVGSSNIAITTGDVTVIQCECSDDTLVTGASCTEADYCRVDGGDQHYITISATNLFNPIFISDTSLTGSVTVQIPDEIP